MNWHEHNNKLNRWPWGSPKAWKTRQPEISFGRSTRPIKKSDRNVCFIFTSIYFECVSVIACIWLPEWGGGYHYVCRDTNMYNKKGLAIWLHGAWLTRQAQEVGGWCRGALFKRLASGCMVNVSGGSQWHCGRFTTKWCITTWQQSFISASTCAI